MTLRWLADLALVGATLVFLAASFAAIGISLRRILGGPTKTLNDGFLGFWVGFAAVIWFLILWNFWLPIDATTLFVVLAMAAACAVLSARSIVQAVRDSRTRPRTGAIAVSVIATVWIAAQCLGPFRSWDGVLYHIQNVAWAKAYPAIPGIANLDARLAFNNSSFLYDALVDSWLWEGRGFHLANSLLLLVLILQGLSAGVRWRRQGLDSNSRSLFDFLLLPIAVYYLPEITTYSTDLPMAVMLSVGIGHAHAWISADSTGAGRVSREACVTSAVLFGAAIAMKLTALIFVAVALAVFAWRSRTWAWTWSVAALVIFLGPWIARGFVMSGYPLFPLPYLGLPFDWRAPAELGRGELAYIGYTEREFSWSFVSRAWVYLTFVRNTGAILIPAVVSAIGAFLWWRQNRPVRRLHDWWLAAPPLAAIAVWLPTAPSHRYGAVIFWTLAAVSISSWMVSSLRASRLTAGTAWLIAVGIAVSPLVASTGSTLLFDRSAQGRNALSRALIGSWEGPLPSLPTDFPVQTFVTRSGFRTNTPQPRANMRDSPNSCGNAPIPCTATPAANLELRDPDHIEQGLRIRGEWEMVNWPYPWRPTFLREWRERRTDR